MPRKSRSLLGEILCHHMVQGINREYIFRRKEDKEKYLNLLKKYYKEYKIEIIAYCIMDNHVHFLLYSSEIQNISNFMRQVNSQYAMYYNKKNNRVGYVYRNRFESIPIMRREQLYICIKYIHMNPVKSGIVKSEEQYEYSSYKDYLYKTCFVNKNILEFLFNSLNNYLEDFKSIEYRELYLEKEFVNIKKILNHFLSNERITLKQLQNERELIQKFINYLISNQYKFSKKELANAIGISRATSYRKIGGQYDKK